jgi:hypothetical protein
MSVKIRGVGYSERPVEDLDRVLLLRRGESTGAVLASAAIDKDPGDHD